MIGEDVLQAASVSILTVYKLLAGCAGSQLTLARKFEAVHKKTVISRQAKPSVLLATLRMLVFLRVLDAALLRDMKDADMSSIGSSSDSERVLLERSRSGSISTGENGSVDAMATVQLPAAMAVL